MGLVLSGTPLDGHVPFSPVWAPKWTESLFNQLMQWQSDIRTRRTKVAMNMRSLGIDPDDPGSPGMVGEKEAAEWRYIYNTLQEYNESFASVTNYYTQIMGVRESQMSNLQARSAGHLAVLGTLFVPMSIITGILSMGGDFLPGERRFWVFWAIVIPILLVSFLCLFSNIIPWARRRLESLGATQRTSK
jgi:Mg2+ and Co2+ transporter CorA